MAAAELASRADRTDTPSTATDPNAGGTATPAPLDPLSRLRRLAADAEALDASVVNSAPTQPRRNDDRPSRVDDLAGLQHAARGLADQLPQTLAEAGIDLATWDQLDDDTHHDLRRYFTQQILPLLVPQGFDAGRPFPHISDRSLNLAVVVTDPTNDRPRFARVEIPNLVPRFLPLPDPTGSARRYIPVEHVVAAQLGQVFPGVSAVEHDRFRVTWARRGQPTDSRTSVPGSSGRRRNAPVSQNAGSRLRRRRLARLEVSTEISDWVLALLQRHLHVDPPRVFRLPDPLDLTAVTELCDTSCDQLAAAWPRQFQVH